MGRLVEHNPFVVIAEVGGRTDQARGCRIEGDHVVIDHNCLRHGLRQKSEPGVMGQDDLVADALQEC